MTTESLLSNLMFHFLDLEPPRDSSLLNFPSSFQDVLARSIPLFQIGLDWAFVLVIGLVDRKWYEDRSWGDKHYHVRLLSCLRLVYSIKQWALKQYLCIRWSWLFMQVQHVHGCLGGYWSQCIHPDFSNPSLDFLLLHGFGLDMQDLLVLRIQPPSEPLLLLQLSWDFPILSLIYKRLWVLLNGIRTHSGFCILPCFNLSLCISHYLSSGIEWYSVTATQFHSFIFRSDFELQRVRPGTLGEPCGPITARHELGGREEHVRC